MLATLRSCVNLLPPPQRWRWVVLVPLALVGAALEAVGAVAVFALIAVINDPARAATMMGVRSITAAFPLNHDAHSVVAATVVVAVFYVVKNLILAGIAAAQNRIVSDSIVAVSRQMVEGYLAMPFSFHFRRNSADLMRNSTHSVDMVFRQVMLPAVAAMTESCIAAAIIAVLMATAPGLTLVAIGVLAGLLAVMVTITRRALIRWGREEQVLRGQILRTLQQTFEGLKEVKIRGREHFFAERFGRYQAALARVRHLDATVSSASRLLIETVFICGVLVVVVLVMLRGSGGTDVVPLLGLYAYAGFRVIPSVNRILVALGNIRYGLGAVEPLHDDVMLFRHTPLGNGAPAAAEVPVTLRERLVLEHVSYTHAGTRTPTLQDITLTIARGESVGVVGPTGAGKSTLIDLILGLLPPSAGRITADGTEISAGVRSWQSKIGYVPQTVYLLDDSLRRNIAFAAPDQAFDERKLWAAVRMAQLEGLVATLPDGLDTVVGERGVRLSGGERQRVAIARALYHEPELLIFDEATSALDSRTEHELTHAIDTLHGAKTLIIIAHRLSTVRHCDRLIFLRGGRIHGIGTLEELCATNADFRGMAIAIDAPSPPSDGEA